MKPKKIFTPAFEKLSSETHGFPVHQDFRVIARWGRPACEEAAVEPVSAVDFEADYGRLLHDLQGLEIINDMNHAGGDNGQ